MSAKTYEDYKAMREHTMPQPVPAPKFTPRQILSAADDLNNFPGHRDYKQQEIQEMLRFAADQAARMEKLPTREGLAIKIADKLWEQEPKNKGKIPPMWFVVLCGGSAEPSRKYLMRAFKIADALIAADVPVRSEP